MTPRGCLYCNGLMWEQHEISAGHHEVCQIKVSQCIPNGGHYWNDPPLGSRYKCDHCGYLGVKNLPTTDERVNDTTDFDTDSFGAFLKSKISNRPNHYRGRGA